MRCKPDPTDELNETWNKEDADQAARVAALEALVTVARKAVAHLAYNAGRPHGDDPGYVTTCALLMRLDAPGGQLAEALDRIDVIATGNAVSDDPEATPAP
jgi:hypothetical protein